MLSAAGTAHLVTRLERDGLVRRVGYPVGRHLLRRLWQRLSRAQPDAR